MATRIVLDLPDDFYERVKSQITIKKPEYAKGFIIDQVTKALNNIEARQAKTAKKARDE